MAANIFFYFEPKYSTGVAYICTETQFPASRLNQLINFRTQQVTFNKKKFSDNIYIHHLPDMVSKYTEEE